MATVNTFNLMLLLVLQTVDGCSSSMVVGRTGEDITLPCRFDLKEHKELSVCWNRGEIPNRECKNTLIATGLYRPTKGTRLSRYRLLGRLEEGDASLMILNVTESDAGRYGCRLRVPGWFNDEKHHIDLIIDRGGDITTTTTGERASEVTTWRGSEAPFSTGSNVRPSEFVVHLDQESPDQPQQTNTLHIFIGNTLRLSFIIFIPALLLAAAHRVWRETSEMDRRLNQSEEENLSV